MEQNYFTVTLCMLWSIKVIFSIDLLNSIYIFQKISLFLPDSVHAPLSILDTVCLSNPDPIPFHAHPNTAFDRALDCTPDALTPVLPIFCQVCAYAR